MDVVVFGASGRIGKAIVQEALKRKHEVTAAVRNPESIELQHERLQIVSANILDPASVAAAVSGHGEIISDSAALSRSFSCPGRQNRCWRGCSRPV